jgi:short-subunit dehydrogenase involved in D-alanine esterification of teichoic acids
LDLLHWIDFWSNPCISAWASNREEVLALAPQLSVMCPPLVTTTSTVATTTEDDQCDLRCSLNEETEDLQQRMNLQDEINSELREQIAELQRQINPRP